MWANKQYKFPVREAFRFHFDEPPAAPLRHEETKRVRKIMNWDKASNKGPEMTSEQTELQYQMSPDMVNRHAPFGTDLSQHVTMKLVGSQWQPVFSENPVIKNQDFSGGSRIHPLRPIADKPNHIDPRIHGDNAGGYYNKDVQSSQENLSPRGYHPLDHEGFNYQKYYDEMGDQPTAFFNKRPDSKDVVRAQFKTLPPIQQNRTRNDMSTVFEAEPWIDRNPSLAKETEYNQNFFPGQEHDFEMYNQSGNENEHSVSAYDKQQLLGLLPGNGLLPVDPIKLTREQEKTLCKLITNDLNRFNPKELRDIYIECSRWDKTLGGYCTLEVVDAAFRHHQVYLWDTLRIVAAQFVDSSRPGYVNYEKILSFIGSALNLSEKGQLPIDRISREKIRKRDFFEKFRDRESREKRHQNVDYYTNQSSSLCSTDLLSPRQQDKSPTRIEEQEPEQRSNDKQPKFYLQNGESIKTGSIYQDREIAKLLRTVEQELAKNSFHLDYTKWNNAFQRMDRDHRETLSAAQIKDICYDHNLPLQDSLINKILSTCDSGNRDGQYKWQDFLRFLERLCPSNTGLPIPVSKRPLEYAKHFPEPGPNWPYADTDTERRDPSPRREYQGSPRRGANRPDDRVQSPVKQTKPSNDRNTNVNANGPDRNAYSPCRRNRDYDNSPPRGYDDKLPQRHRDNKFNSPEPRERYASPPRDKDCYHQPHNTRRVNDYNNYDRQERRKENTERRNEQDRYRHSRKDVNEARDGRRYNDRDERRRSYAEEPRGYKPSWQDQAQYRSTSPPPQRRIIERETFRDDRKTDSEYERHWRKWAYKNDRQSKAAPRAPSNYNRPQSYIEPPIRKASQQLLPDLSRRRPFSYRDETRSDNRPLRRSLSRNLGPVSRQQSTRRFRSLSPVRQPSPNRYQSHPMTHREPITDPNQDYSRGQYPLDSMKNKQEQEARYDHERDTYRRDRREDTYRDGYRPSGGKGDETHRSVEDQMNTLSHQIQDLEKKHQITKDGLRSNDKPWMDRYIKMAKALYNSDITSKGSLPRKDVMDIVKQYNSAFNLELDMNRADMLSISPENLDKSGNIILRAFLASLSADRTTYKP